METQISLNLSSIKIDNATQRTAAVIGGKGTGKTQTLKMLLLKSEIKTVFFDTLNVVPEMEGTNRITISRKNIEQGEAFGKILTKLKYDKLIISMIDFSQEESAKFIDALFFAWKPADMLIFIDEIHEVAPERGMGMEYSTEFERAIRHWRNRNVGFVFSTQRPAFTSKKVLGLIDYIILYRLTYPNDLRVVKETISGMLKPEQTEQVMNSLQSKGFLEGYAVDFQT